MKNILLLTGAALLVSQCQPKRIPQSAAVLPNQEFRINLNQTINLTDSRKTALGKITFTHLDESRCPANAMCVRQGAAITTFTIGPGNGEKQKVRLFIGDFMPDDPGIRRNRTADTAVVQLKNKTTYQLILKAVLPYPGTSAEAPAATLVLKSP
jgi:hypothetical protein